MYYLLLSTPRCHFYDKKKKKTNRAKNEQIRFYKTLFNLYNLCR